MILQGPCRNRRRFRPRRGFTLVELITAASLMSLMMLGVVQIFGIITQTATEAQGAAFAMEQGRALMDAIHRDIRGFDRSGYFKIQVSDTDVSGLPGAFTDPGIPSTPPKPGVHVFWEHPITWYSSDCLALTSVGFAEGQNNNTIKRATGAEVVYTTNVLTPVSRLTVSNNRVDPRRGVLARAAWVIGPTGGATGTTSNADDTSAARVLADIGLGTGRTPDRLMQPDGKDTTNALAVSPVQVTPILTGGGATSGGSLWQVRRAAACCVSEFRIDALEIITSGTPAVARTQWTRRPWTIVPTPPGATSGGDAECPRAIRVTVAFHDPADKRPTPGASGRYEGYALQETFWIGDP